MDKTLKQLIWKELELINNQKLIKKLGKIAIEN